MPALDIDCCQQVIMATVAPEAALEAAALATLKRTGISISGNSNNGNQSNEPANVLSKLSASLQQQHQPLKKRRLANALLTPTTSLKSASTHSSLSSSSSTSQRPDHNQYHYAAAATAHSHSNGDISTGFNGSDDLTNLNWLQDANLLKSIYSSGPSVDSSSDASSSAQAAAAETGDFVIAQRRPPLNNQQNHPHHQQHPPLHRKPPYSYSALIFLAIESSPSKSMMVRDIYTWIVQNFPFFATAPAGWKNTIRHTLSLRKCFKKVDRCTGAEIAAGDSDSDSGDNKGGLWHVDDEYRATLQQLVARAQQNVLPKLVMSGRRVSAAERVVLPKKKVTHWGGTGRGGSGKGRWPLKTTPLGDVHYLQNGKQHNGAAAAAAVMPVMPGQKFIQVPVIRSFLPHRYHPHPHPHPHPHHHHHRVNRCQPPAEMTQADVRTSAEAQGCEAASYKLQLMTLNKLNSSSSSSHGGHTHRSTAHIPRRPTAISAAAARNSVSVISVNQAPKVYAPVPKVTVASCAGGGDEVKPIAASNHHQHYHYQHYHYLHQPPAPSQPSSPVACLQPLSNAKDALTAAPHLQKFLPSSKKPAAAVAEKHKAQSSAVMTAAAAAAASVAGISSSPHIVCPPSYNHLHLHHCHYQPPPPPQSTGNSVFVKKFLLSPSDDEDEEEEDMLIRDGAEALLNFASSAFSLNRLIKQED